MRIAVIGTGYVGLVTGACFADLGHDVTCVDSDASKIELLNAGKCPLYEPGLAEMITRNREAKRLHFTRDTAETCASAEIIFIAVGTPASEQDGLPDLGQIKAATAAVARAAKDGAVIVIKSTVPIGTVRVTAQQVAEFRGNTGPVVASNPEFLRQGSAVDDFMTPDRIVIGVNSNTARDKLTELYLPFTENGIPLIVTTFESAEMIKYAANTMLAAKIAFINEIADICEKVSANIRDVARGVGLDPRIGSQFLQAGPGFGGSCFPKDTQALQGIANSHTLITPLVDAVVTSNLQRKHRMLEKIIKVCGGSVKGKTIALLGLTFKPETDDLRESVSLTLLPALLAQGARMRTYDPQGMEHAKRIFSGLPTPERSSGFAQAGDIAWASDVYDAVKGADAAVVITEWNEFKSADLVHMGGLMKTPLVIDLRNIYKRRRMVAAGFRYVSIGRSEVSPEHPDVIDLLPETEEAA